MRKLLIGIAVVSAIAFTACTETDTPTYDPAPIQTELTSYNGSTVSQGVEIMWAAGGQDVICPLIDQYGYAAARTSFLTTDPQLGSDAYEGAVFDEFVQEAC